MTRSIEDLKGDFLLSQERADRLAERQDNPSTHLDYRPQRECIDCGEMPREVRPSVWACACDVYGALS